MLQLSSTRACRCGLPIEMNAVNSFMNTAFNIFHLFPSFLFPLRRGLALGLASGAAVVALVAAVLLVATVTLVSVATMAFAVMASGSTLWSSSLGASPRLSLRGGAAGAGLGGGAKLLASRHVSAVFHNALIGRR